MRIPLNRNSRTPLYRQVADYIRSAVLDGSFPPESRLPAVRDMAKKNSVSRITVEKAYEALEAESLVQIRPGSGVYTLSAGPPPAPVRENGSDRQTFRPFDHTGSGDMVDFSYGGGDPRLFPVRDFRSCLQKTATLPEEELFAYGDIRGYGPLRESVARILTSQGLRITPDRLLVTNGSQQALSLICRRFLRRGSRILTEANTYGEALNLFRTEGYEIVPVPMDENGMNTGALEKILKTAPADLIYTIPNFQNPTGTTLPEERRRHLISLADRYNTPVVEDDYIGDLSYGSPCPPSLKAMDPTGRVIYIGTFSKMLMPGLRFGFLAAEEPFYGDLVNYKRYSDLTSPGYLQRAVHSFISLGRYRNHIESSRRIYRKRRDRMAAALREFFPEEWQFQTPGGGLFLWLPCPKGFYGADYVRAAAGRQVRVPDGSIFRSAPRREAAGLRLNFASRTEEEITRGVRRMARALEDQN